MGINNLTKHHPFSPGCIRFQLRSTDDSKDGTKTIVVAVATATATTTWMPQQNDTTTKKKNYDVVSHKAWVRRVNCASFIRSIANGFLLPKHHHLDLRMACQDTPGSNSWVESCVCCFACSPTVARPQDLGIEIEQKVWIWTNPVREVVETGFYATLQASMSCARLAMVLHPNSTDSSKCRSHCSKHRNLDARSRPISKTRHWEKKIENLSTWICSHLQVPNEYVLDFLE